MPPKRTTPVKTPAARTTKPAAARSTATKPGASPKKTAAKPGQTAAGKKPAQAGKSKGGTETKAKPKEEVKKWTPQDDAARTIQTKVRQFLAKAALRKKKKEKEEYNELMEKLEREAFVKLAKMEQEAFEREREKEEAERRRKREEAKRRKRMLEAAFDGDNDEILNVLREVADMDTQQGVGHDLVGRVVRAKHELAMVDCEDANENTPLSEASSGGHVETIKLLIEKGANINSQGQFSRTPLYRAAFAGHLEACQMLLQYGADPRTYASDGQTPEQVASQDSITELLRDWDISQTEHLLEKIESEKERRREEDRKRREEETNKLGEKVDEAKKVYEAQQKQVQRLTMELNKRIEEHDTAVASGFEKPEITLQAIHDAETELELMRIEYEKARDRLSQIKLQLREKKMEGQAEDGEADEQPGIKVNIRELDEVLMRDVGNKIKDSGKWPLIIDPSGQASIFLRYRDTNYLNALSPSQMEADKVRLAILGAIRYGKPAVLDMMEVDMFDTVSMRCDEIKKDLLSSIMDKSILQNESYLALIRDKDGPAYAKTNFNDFYVQNFRFFIVTKNLFPPESLLDQTYPIRVVVST